MDDRDTLRETAVASVRTRVTCTASARHCRHSPLLAIVLVFRPPPLAMQTINRFLYGPTPEEKVRAWQVKLRSEQRVIEREMRQVRRRPWSKGLVAHCVLARYRHEEGAADSEAAGEEGRCEICADNGQGGCA